MHIPDGYLSPSTCAVAFAAAAPFWYVAAKRMQRSLHTRVVPLMAVFSAFSFVVMMFNIPLPGGTTGHAAGMGIAAVVLGPWGAILALSIALLMQAVFFGDGGITAFGANCFNIAIVGGLVAFAVYRLAAGHSAPDSRRRVWAAGLAGYLALNAAALATAVEFGLQPWLFSDATGTPMYAPYPLSIAVPAMMLPHLLVAGVAEAAVTAGVVAYLQKSDPDLLGAGNPGVTRLPGQGFWHTPRGLWLGLALLMIASPLGLLASATAWGEWAPEAFEAPAARSEIAAASAGQAPATEGAPLGLARLAAVWTAPVPDYAPAFLRSAALGYMLSAALGGGLIILALLGFDRLAAGRRATSAPRPPP